MGRAGSKNVASILEASGTQRDMFGQALLGQVGTCVSYDYLVRQFYIVLFEGFQAVTGCGGQWVYIV